MGYRKVQKSFHPFWARRRRFFFGLKESFLFLHGILPNFLDEILSNVPCKKALSPKSYQNQ